MFALAARRMGYRIHTFSPDSDSPTGQIADCEMVGDYADEAAVRRFASGIDALTFEFENIPATTVAWCEEVVPVRPAGRVLEICQHRLREKQWLSENGFPVVGFRSVNSLAQLETAVRELGLPAILKTAAFGYDGKGQSRIKPGDDLSAVWERFQGVPAILEAFAPFDRELSILVARSIHGAVRTWPICENLHKDHILDVTIAPAPLPPLVAKAIEALGHAVAEKIDLVGVLAVELFLLGSGEVLVNEMAPRPHNSGHFSFDASATSQFEQQVRAVCGLPLGETDSFQPSAMANLLGDAWADGEPNWAAALAVPGVKLHLYGKAEPRAGRKMGHLTALGATVEEARERVLAARAALNS
jgi:5-(carboxyamino)imidazole ribonucleotide synthase